MKIGLRLWILWAASLVIFTGAAVAAWLGMELMDGVSGLTIRFFLCYCGIIVAFQSLFALDAVRGMLRDLPGNNKQEQPGRRHTDFTLTTEKTRGSL